MTVSRPISIIVALGVVTALFITTALLSYQKFRAELVDRQFLDQKKLSQIITQSLNQYFRRVQQVTEFAALNDAFDPEKTVAEDNLKYELLTPDRAERWKESVWLQKVLPNPAATPAQSGELFVWQLFRGLPQYREDGQLVAAERRRIANQALMMFRDLEFFYEMEANGDMIFVEPFSAQKTISRFNYSFRDYLKGPKETKASALSDTFISLVSRSTQAITVSTPIFDKSQKVAKVVCASVSNAIIRQHVFQPLISYVGIRDKTVFYFIDRHGHVVASSSNIGDYDPTPSAASDEQDRGNFRNYGPLAGMAWADDKFEVGTDWERSSKSWVISLLRTTYSAEYTSQNGEQVLGTFYPISLIDGRPPRYGILIETPITVIRQSQKQLYLILLGTGLLLLLILFSFGQAIWKLHASLARELAEKETQLREISTRVAHDVRSPLAALQFLLPSIKDQPEHIRIVFRELANRINDLANDLMQSKERPAPRGKAGPTTNGKGKA